MTASETKFQQSTDSSGNLFYDESIVALLADGLARERRDRQSFIDSTTFDLMLSSLRDSDEARCVTTDDVSYRLEETRSHLGWTFATEEDMNRFMDILGDVSAPSVHSQPLNDPENSFPNATFEHYGLNVNLMIGQGTFICVFNEKERQRRTQVIPES